MSPSKRLCAALAVTATTLALTAASMWSADAGVTPHTVARSGHGSAPTPRLVNLGKLRPGGVAHAWNHGPLLRSGKFSGTQLASRPSSGHKAGAGVVPSLVQRRKSSFTGIDQASANCNCQPPDVNAAIGPSNIVESVNLDLAVYSKTGTLQKSTGLNTFLGTSDPLSDPRVVWDPTYNRWALSLTDITAAGATPTLWFAVSVNGNPSGGWYVFHFGFSGGAFPAGELLDYPVLGMDADSFIISTNNYTLSGGSYTYNGSTVFSVPKARAYNAFSISFGAFAVPFGTVPAIVGGHPTQNGGKTYVLSPDAGADQMHVYYLMNTSRPDSVTLTHQADIAYSWNPPPRRVNQPGTAATLDPSDGRLDWAPTQLDNGVWFAHGVDIGGFPGVNFGLVDTSANTISVGTAFHSNTSDDFNPSIAAENGPNGVQAVLTWATTDTAANQPTTDYASVQLGTTLAHQSGTAFSPVGSITSENRFGDYSSVSPEYNAVGTCGEGSYALVANQYFETNGTWTTRLSQVGLC